MATMRCKTKKELALAMPGDTKVRDEELAKLAWALAHPVRVRIVRILLERETCICGEIVDEIPLAQSTVSQHLKILKESGIVQGEIDGPKVCYCVVPGALQRMKKLIAEF
jgi:ArsR family transcriptional regulator, arsenate/arsenite/antimonite-responsive transcriptional repressor